MSKTQRLQWEPLLVKIRQRQDWKPLPCQQDSVNTGNPPSFSTRQRWILEPSPCQQSRVNSENHLIINKTELILQTPLLVNKTEIILGTLSLSTRQRLYWEPFPCEQDRDYTENPSLVNNAELILGDLFPCQHDRDKIVNKTLFVVF